MKRWSRIALIVIVVLVLVLLIGPFLVPIPSLEGAVPLERLADPDSRFVEVGGLQVHYKAAGAGDPTLILLHGFGSSVFSWREVMEPLAGSGATVVAFDRPAFGLTERPLPGEWEGESPYSAEAQADLTIALMDELGIADAVLVGNSAGGTVAILTALRYPQRVRALVLVDAAVYTEGGVPWWIHPLLRTPQMRRLGPLLARRIRDWGEDLVHAAWHDPSGLTAEVREGYAKPLQAENWDRALWEATLANRPLGLAERLDEVQMPVLVITGDDDRVVPTEQSIRLADALPGAELVVIPECGHLPQEERPEAFLQAIAAFLAELQ